MSGDTMFEAVDSYIDGLFVETDEVLDAVLERAKAAGLPEMQVSPGQGKLLYLMAKLIGAKTHSRSRDAGRLLHSLACAGDEREWGADHAGARACSRGICARDTRERKSVRQLRGDRGPGARIDEGVGAAIRPCFLDANKDQYPAYLREAVRLTRSGGIILADNVVRSGTVLAPAAVDPAAIGAAAFNQALAEHPKLEAIILQQVGLKGHDGMAIARVKD